MRIEPSIFFLISRDDTMLIRKILDFGVAILKSVADWVARHQQSLLNLFFYVKGRKTDHIHGSKKLQEMFYKIAVNLLHLVVTWE